MRCMPTVYSSVFTLYKIVFAFGFINNMYLVSMSHDRFGGSFSKSPANGSVYCTRK